MADQIVVGKIWTEAGTSTLRGSATVSDFEKGGVPVLGEGKGGAGYSAADGVCSAVGEWLATYAVTGIVDTQPTCRLSLRIETKWTKGTGFAACPWGTNTSSVPDYTETFTATFENNAAIAFSTSPAAEGAMMWSNKIELSGFTAGRCGFIRMPQ